MIIGLTGLPAAGKGTIAKHLVEHHGAQTLRFSEPLRDIIKRVYKDPSREYMSHLATFLRGEFGPDILITTLLHDIGNNTDGKIYVLDGMRYVEEFEVLSRRNDFQMWAVVTDFDTRYARIVLRDENTSDKSLSKDQFKNQHTLPTEIFIPELIKKASVIIDNNGSRDELFQRVDALVKSLA